LKYAYFLLKVARKLLFQLFIFRSVSGGLTLREEHITFVPLTCAYPDLPDNITLVSNNTNRNTTMLVVFEVGEKVHLQCFPMHYIALNVSSAIIKCTGKCVFVLASPVKCAFLFSNVCVC